MKRRFLALALLLSACGNPPPPTPVVAGEWLGTFTFSGKFWVNGREISPGNIPIAITFIQIDNVLRGRASEVDSVKGPAHTLNSEIAGHFTGGRSFRIVKRFTGDVAGSPEIVYTGTVSDDGYSIHGEWEQLLPEPGKGTFSLRKR